MGLVKSMKYLQLVIISLILLVLLGCEKSAPNGRIRVRNDIEDAEYNIVNISGGGASISLKPGESQLMPKGTTNMYWSRAYKNYTRSYQVECPTMSSTSSGITLKMIDVHLNRMAGGCKTTSASK